MPPWYGCHCLLCANNDTLTLAVLSSLSTRGEHGVGGESGLDAGCRVWADCICACVPAEPPPCAGPVTVHEAVCVVIAVSRGFDNLS